MFQITRPSLTFLSLTLAVCLVWASRPSAHEFWIDPERYQVAAGENIVANFRNGEEFQGTQLAFFDRRSDRLEIAHGSTSKELSPRNGDRPAIDVAALGDGLHIVAHETTASSLTYKTWEKFQKFADHKDFPDIRARHDARGLPEANFKESYTRHVKSLLAVNTANGADRALGLRTEFVALTNPYAATFDLNMQIQLYEDGKLRPDAQVEIFEKAPDGSVIVSLTRTDGTGRAGFQTKPGHSYLIDAVVLAPSDQDGIAWETYWAALTFAVPAR